MRKVKATPNGTSTMWKPRVNAIISRAGSSCGGSPAAAYTPCARARIGLMSAILPHLVYPGVGRGLEREQGWSERRRQLLCEGLELLARHGRQDVQPVHEARAAQLQQAGGAGDEPQVQVGDAVPDAVSVHPADARHRLSCSHQAHREL